MSRSIHPGGGENTVEGLRLLYRALAESDRNYTKARHLERHTTADRARLAPALKAATAFGWVVAWNPGGKSTTWRVDVDGPCCDDPHPVFDGHVPHVAAFGGGDNCDIPDGGFCVGDAGAECANCGTDLKL